MYFYRLFLAVVSVFSVGTVFPFTILNGSPYAVTLKLDWYAKNEKTHRMELAQTHESLFLTSGESTVIHLTRACDELWVTMLYADGTQEAPFKLAAASYEKDKTLDDTCFLLLSSRNEKELQCNLAGKTLAKAIKTELLHYQQRLAEAKQSSD